MHKREFIKTIALAGFTLPALGADAEIQEIISRHSHLSPLQLAPDEDFWASVRGDFKLKPDYINLENGYYSMMPESTLLAYINHVKDMNLQASWYMRTKMTDDKAGVRKKLAEFLDCPAEELIVTRNTTESIDTVISGMDWRAGDEAIMAQQDYGSMLDMFAQQARRYGIVNKILSVPNHPENDEEIVSMYEKAITPGTRLLMVCHMINISGQILPVKKICDMARMHGVKVLVDGAHAIAHFDFKITDLGCDYYGASLHKWLGVPLGAGLLYVKKENIPGLWPLFADSGYADDDIRKLNHTGTHPMHVELTIENAINFHNSIGSKRKEERLRYLQTYWTSKLRNHPGVVINTPSNPERCCGIANVGISKMKPAEMAAVLLQKHKIWTVAIDRATVQGCRITPGIFTTVAEMDKLTEAVKEMS
jgi:selenocysteine lyase/cysteine desulfurase